LDHQNNYVGNSGMMSNKIAAKNFNILTINLSVSHNYFDLQLFLYLTKVLDTRYL